MGGIVKKINDSFSKNGANILFGSGLALITFGWIKGVSDTPKAIKLIEIKKKELNIEELTKKEKIKTVWKCYIPSGLSFITGVSMLIASKYMDYTQYNHALTATAIGVTEGVANTYRDRLIEELGPDKGKEVDKEVRKTLETSPIQRDIIITERGNTLFKDDQSGRFFRSTKANVDNAIAEINNQIYSGSYNEVDLNEFYYLLGLDNIRMGDKIGWNIDNHLIMKYESGIENNGNEPYIALLYDVYWIN